MKSDAITGLLNAGAMLLVVAVIAAWTYVMIYAPLAAGKWTWVLSLIAAGLCWTALKAAARRRAESIDYRRN
jgi:membrane protein implicated in regulation of membrane protease activity